MKHSSYDLCELLFRSFSSLYFHRHLQIQNEIKKKNGFKLSKEASLLLILPRGTLYIPPKHILGPKS